MVCAEPTSASRPQASPVGNAGTGGPRSALGQKTGMVDSLEDCAVAVGELLHATNSRSTRAALSEVATKSMKFLQENHGRFRCMMDTLRSLPVPKVDVEKVRRWFGDVRGFPDIDLLVQIVRDGAPVAVSEKGDFRAAITYGNHSAVSQ